MQSQSWSRREVLRLGAGGLLGSRWLPGAARRPNIVIILADDMGYADVGFQGCKDIPTPHLDRLAAGGVRFTSGCVSHPFCSPTRAGLMTGRYQQRFGHENNPRYDPADEVAGLPTSEVTLAQVMKDAGYVTGHVGKWHLGAAPKFHPLRRGFQESFGFLGGGHDYFRAGDPSKEYFIPIQRNGKAIEEPEYLTDAFSREADQFIRRHRGEPFFLYLAYNSPHTPQQAPAKYLDRFATVADRKRQYYGAMVSAVDDGVGRVMATLDELKLDRQTLVFFLSDNGGPTAVNGSRNDPLRGAKGQVYEGGIRVPFVMRWKGRLPGGRQYHEPVISLDIFPTAAAAAGARAPSNLDGVNLLPHIEGKVKTPPHERLFWRTGGGASWAVREGRYKLLQVGQNDPEMYDLQEDVGETNDVAVSRGEITKRLRAAYQNWNRELAAPLFESPQPAARRQKQKKS